MATHSHLPAPHGSSYGARRSLITAISAERSTATLTCSRKARSTPRAPSARAARLDRGRMGRVGQQSRAKFYKLTAAGRARYPRRITRVASARGRDRRRAGANVAGAGMSVGPGWRRLLRLPSRRSIGVERDVDDEIAFHLAMREEKLRRLGRDADAAQAEARARFGDQRRFARNASPSTGATRARRESWNGSNRSGPTFAMRSATLRRMPAFTAVATLTLALGIGATTAHVQPRRRDSAAATALPRRRTNRPGHSVVSGNRARHVGLSQENIAMYRDRSTDFESFAAYRTAGVTLTGDGAPTGSTRLW